MVRSPEDVVQEALILLASESHAPRDIAAWLYRVVRTRAINAARSSRRRKQHERAAALPAVEWFAPSPGDALDAQEAAVALGELSAPEREVVIMHVWGGLTFAQMGQVIGTSDSTAHRHYLAALACALTETEDAMSQARMNHENDELEARLASLQPRPSSLDRNRLIYLAGQAAAQRRLKMRRRLRVLGIGGILAAAAALFLASGLWLTPSAEAEKAAQVLARGAEAVPNPTTIHIVAKMRIPPGHYFQSIDADGALVPVEVWRQFGDRPKWRIEKSDMIEVMDDWMTTLLNSERKRGWRDELRRGQPNPRDLLLLNLADVRGLINHELTAALANQWGLKLAHKTTAAGKKKLVVTVEAKTDFPLNNSCRDTFTDAADMRRVYRFDAHSKRLEGMDAYLHRSSGGDVLILTVESIEYDEPIDPAVFMLKLPKDVTLHDWRIECKEPELLPDNEKYEQMTPKEAARAFFEACAKEDWDEVQKFVPHYLDEGFKEQWGGLRIVSLGEPFHVRTYYGWFIPYEVEFKNGGGKKMNLAMRKDNPAKRYVIDGGY